MNKLDGIVIAIGGCLSLFGLYEGLKTKKQREQNETQVQALIDKLSDGVEPITVTDEVIRAAAEKAADRAAEKAVIEVRDDIRHKVNSAVNAAHDEVVKKVADDYTKKVEECIDLEKIRESVEKDASKVVVNKLLNKVQSYSDSIILRSLSSNL